MTLQELVNEPAYGEIILALNELLAEFYHDPMARIHIHSTANCMAHLRGWAMTPQIPLPEGPPAIYPGLEPTNEPAEEPAEEPVGEPTDEGTPSE